jgi:alpha-galactosidase
LNRNLSDEKNQGEKMKERMVLIGAGSAMFTRGLVMDMIRAGWEADLVLVDIDAEALKVAERLAQKMVAASRARIEIRATTDRRAALPGASVVITTIGVGGRRAWEQDVFIPRRYGINMPVGDTAGPGGTSRALRMIPAMVDIAHDVLDLAPNALFFNYANPMAPVCRAVRKATGAEMVGLCIGTYETSHFLAQQLGIPYESLSFSAGGINHLTWIYNLRIGNKDALPLLKQKGEELLHQLHARLEQARQGKAELPHCGSPFESSMGHPFSWQLLSWFDAFPAPQDRHVTEFFPQFFREGRYYGKTLGVDEFSFEGTIAAGDHIYSEMTSLALRSEAIQAEELSQVGGEHEQVIAIIESIRESGGRVFFANLPNAGQVSNLPLGAILETPAVTDPQGLHAVIQKPLPTAAAGILATRFAWVEMVVEAALEGSRTKFINALILDGAVSSPDQAAALAGELIEANRVYLPQF